MHRKLRKTQLFPQSQFLTPALCCYLSLAHVACGELENIAKEKDEDKKGEAAPALDEATKKAIFIKSADIDLSANTKKMSKAELVYEINKETDFYNNTGGDSSEKEDDANTETNKDPCTDAFATGNFKGSKGRLEFSIDFNKTDCKKENDEAETKSVNTSDYAFKLYVLALCDNVDFSALDGKSAEEGNKLMDADEESFKCKAPMRISAAASNLKVKSTTIYTIKSNSQTADFVYESEVKTASLGSDDGVCSETRDGETYIEDGCTELEYERSKTSGSAAGGKADEIIETRKLVKKKLVNSDDKSHYWYGGGTIDVTLANWQGTFTYTAFDEAGSFSMSNGTDKAEADLKKWGTIQPAPTSSGLAGATDNDADPAKPEALAPYRRFIKDQSQHWQRLVRAAAISRP